MPNIAFARQRLDADGVREPDFDLVDNQGSWSAIELPSGHFLLAYDGVVDQVNGRDLANINLAHQLNANQARWLARAFGRPDSAHTRYEGKRLGKALFFEIGHLLRPELDRQTLKRRWRIRLHRWILHDQPVIEGGATVTITDNLTYPDGNLEDYGLWGTSSNSSQPIKIESNQAVYDYGGGDKSDVIGWIDTGETDHTMQADKINPGTSNGTVGVCGRYSDSSNYWEGRWAGNHELFKVVGGSSSRVGIDFSHGISAPYTIELDFSGSTITSRDTGDNSTLSTTDTDLDTNTQVGMRMSNTFAVRWVFDDPTVIYEDAGPVEIDPVESASTSSADTAGITATTNVDPVGSTSTTTSDVAAITGPPVEIDPVGTTSATSSDSVGTVSPGTYNPVTDLVATSGANGQVVLTWSHPIGINT